MPPLLLQVTIVISNPLFSLSLNLFRFPSHSYWNIIFLLLPFLITRLGGVADLIAIRRERTLQYVMFNIFSMERNLRLKIGRRIRRIFTENLSRMYGGYAERLQERNQDGFAVYRVLIVSAGLKAGIQLDPDFLPLWVILLDEFGVDLESSEFGPFVTADEHRELNPGLDLKFSKKFFIHKLTEDEPEDWSEIGQGDFDDNASNFSVVVGELF